MMKSKEFYEESISRLQKITKLLSVLRYTIPPPYAMGEAKQKRFLSSPQN